MDLPFQFLSYFLVVLRCLHLRDFFCINHKCFCGKSWDFHEFSVFSYFFELFCD